MRTRDLLSMKTIRVGRGKRYRGMDGKGWRGSTEAKISEIPIRRYAGICIRTLTLFGIEPFSEASQ
jgi:hypothetical protein